MDLYIKVGERYEKVGQMEAGLLTALLPKQEAAQGGAGYSEAFEAFWGRYPRRIGKGAAWAAWRKIRGGAGVYEAIGRALEAQKASQDWRREAGAFIPHPSTWLNQRRWEDDHTPPAALLVPAKPVKPGCEECGQRLPLEDFHGNQLCCFCRAKQEDLMDAKDEF
jgi:hypothetical protein